MSAIFLCLIASPYNSAAKSLGFTLINNNWQHNQLRVSVLDELSGISIDDATISVSNMGGSWSNLHELTVSKKGYSSITILGLKGGDVLISLKPLPNKPDDTPDDTSDVIATGSMADWLFPEITSKVRAGFVLRTLSAFDLISFNISYFVSPLKDTIDVFGKREIPSNISLPRQKISIFLNKITLDKPDFRLPIQRAQKSHLVALRGDMAVRHLITGMNANKVSNDIINKVNFLEAAIAGPFIKDDNFAVDFTPFQKLAKKHTVTVATPPFKADVVVMAVMDLTGEKEFLAPTDAKLAVNSTVELKGITNQASDIIAAAVANRGAKISGILSGNAGASSRLGPFLATSPAADAHSLPPEVIITAPTNGLGAAVFEAKHASTSQVVPLWYVYSLPSVGTIKFSTTAFADAGKTKQYSSIQMEFGESFAEESLDGATLLRDLKRFSRATAQIK